VGIEKLEVSLIRMMVPPYYNIKVRSKSDSYDGTALLTKTLKKLAM
jgi:hypothetical protein